VNNQSDLALLERLHGRDLWLAAGGAKAPSWLSLLALLPPPTTTIMSLIKGSSGGPGRVIGQLLQRRTGGLFGHLCAPAGTALSDTDPLKGRLAVSAISQIGMDDTRAAAIT
jgi:hypothetical protein